MTQLSTPDSNTATTSANVSSDLDAVLARTMSPHAEEEKEEEQAQEEAAKEQEQEDKEEKAFNVALKKAVKAFIKGNKGLLIARVECGKYCHEAFTVRAADGNKDRKLTSQIIFNQLAPYADSRGDCDPNLLAKMYKTVDLLCGEERWKAICKMDKHPLTVGKLEDLATLIVRVEPSECYTVFDKAKLDDAKALFDWACGDGMNIRSRKDIAGRVQELKDPAKYAQKQAEKAAEEAKAKAKEDAEADGEEPEEEEEKEVTPPKNMIATQPDKTRPAPNGKDVPDGMAALLKEGNKQEPGHMADMLKQFAEQFVWTAPMVKGLLDGIVDSKDAAAGERAMQLIVDTIGEEYSIYPQSEMEDAA
jgi:hypothetical protein